MKQTRATFEILAGEGIGPFSLGMTRAQVREIAERELRTSVEAQDNSEGNSDAVGDTGITIHYDENGFCKRVQALFGYVAGQYAFTLFGNDICGMGDKAVIRLCKDHWSDVYREYGGVDVPSAGFWAGYWESASDGCFTWVNVKPRRCDNAGASTKRR
jgi:hypothetical protein